MGTATKKMSELRTGERVHVTNPVGEEVLCTVATVWVSGSAEHGTVTVTWEEGVDDTVARGELDATAVVEVEDPDWDGTYDPFADEHTTHSAWMACFDCNPVHGQQRRCVGEGPVTKGFDPTQTYRLECGHLAI